MRPVNVAYAAWTRMAAVLFMVLDIPCSSSWRSRKTTSCSCSCETCGDSACSGAELGRRIQKTGIDTPRFDTTISATSTKGLDAFGCHGRTFALPLIVLMRAQCQRQHAKHRMCRDHHRGSDREIVEADVRDDKLAPSDTFSADAAPSRVLRNILQLGYTSPHITGAETAAPGPDLPSLHCNRQSSASARVWCRKDRRRMRRGLNDELCLRRSTKAPADRLEHALF